jgi:predicted nucleic acid-binding protein
MKILLDTNVVLDVAMKRQAFYPDAVAVLNKLKLNQNNISAYISSSIAMNTVYILGKATNQEQALLFLQDLIKTIGIIGVGKKTIINAILSGGKDFEDAVQEQAAIENGIDIIITRNVKDFQETETLKIMTPGEFLKAIS